MRFRLISSALLLPVFVWAMFHGGVWFRLFMLAAVLLGYEEYRRLLSTVGLRFKPWMGLFVLLYTLLPAAAGPLPAPWSSAWASPLDGPLVLSFFFVAAAVMRVWDADLRHGLSSFVAEIGGLAYLGLLGLAVIRLHALGAWWLFLAFWYAWIYDSGALFVGKSLGRTPFSPLSPGKTWEGFWGGVLTNAALSALILPLVSPAGFPLKAWSFAALSVPASVLAQAGDLFESMVKRFAGAKDSSRLISTHGGVLDKIDSSLFVAPLLVLAALLLGGA